MVFTDHAGTSSLACMAKHAPARMSSHLRFGSVDEAPQLNLPACVFGYAAHCLQSRSDLRSAATSMRLNSDTTPPSVGRASKLLPPPFKNQRTHRSNLQRVSSNLACFLCIRKIAGCPDSSHQGTLRRPSAATPEQELKAPSCRIRAGLLSSVVSSPAQRRWKRQRFGGKLSAQRCKSPKHLGRHPAPAVTGAWHSNFSAENGSSPDQMLRWKLEVEDFELS